MIEYTFSDELVSDLYKDVYGTRSMNRWWKDMNDDQKQVEWDYLVHELNRVCDRENEEKKEAFGTFTERLRNHSKLLNIPFVDVIRWEMEADNLDPTKNHDIEQYVWGMGVDIIEGAKYCKGFLNA